MSRELETLRNQINEIDTKLLDLLCQRMAVSKVIGQYKKDVGAPVFDAEREKELIKYLQKNGAKQGLDAQMIEELWEKILLYSKKKQGDVEQ